MIHNKFKKMNNNTRHIVVVTPTGITVAGGRRPELNGRVMFIN
jgi:hypothetical protein